MSKTRTKANVVGLARISGATRAKSGRFAMSATVRRSAATCWSIKISAPGSFHGRRPPGPSRRPLTVQRASSNIHNSSKIPMLSCPSLVWSCRCRRKAKLYKSAANLVLDRAAWRATPKTSSLVALGGNRSRNASRLFSKAASCDLSIAEYKSAKRPVCLKRLADSAACSFTSLKMSCAPAKKKDGMTRPPDEPIFVPSKSSSRMFRKNIANMPASVAMVPRAPTSMPRRKDSTSMLSKNTVVSSSNCSMDLSMSLGQGTAAPRATRPLWPRRCGLAPATLRRLKAKPW
mmetsp:Transcript_48773/g.148383  ORF Transcript_48773/g.148383 Transcript_48773/m.148383 type:complete len:289 (+) Transcript_48773:832-1698(+)